MYQALARKWRPKSLAEVIGQSTTIAALNNSLEQNRIHHAYLFTGMRGVGKTSLARILAKCLNCEQGITANCCGKCRICTDIDNGNFIDLIEVDAASKTKVEDTRELLNNIQYLPSYGRFKIYIIDEVHMLSGHSFNALLKTLEEPPEHVKFILATTEPEKLPITILSRCLEFHLSGLTISEIVNHLQNILTTEGIDFEPQALSLVCKAAEGSMRDSLSILEKAISVGNNKVTSDNVREMLGYSNEENLVQLLNLIIDADANSLFANIKDLAANTLDFSKLLAQMLEVLHKVAVLHVVESAYSDNEHEKKLLMAIVGKTAPEQIQLLYQIGLNGQRDLPYAPDPFLGFEMTLLRMLAFVPMTSEPVDISPRPLSSEKTVNLQNNNITSKAPNIPNASNIRNSSNTISTAKEVTNRQVATSNAVTSNIASSSSAITKPPTSNTGISNPATSISARTNTSNNSFSEQNIVGRNEQPMTSQRQESPASLDSDIKGKLPNWAQVVSKLDLKGLVKSIALHCVLNTWENNFIKLTLDEAQAPLLSARHSDKLELALGQYLGRKIRLEITTSNSHEQQKTPALQTEIKNKKEHDEAVERIDNDQNVQSLKSNFGAVLKDVAVIKTD